LNVDSDLETDVTISKFSLNVNLDKGDNNRGREARDCYLQLDRASAGVREFDFRAYRSRTDAKRLNGRDFSPNHRSASATSPAAKASLDAIS